MRGGDIMSLKEGPPSRAFTKLVKVIENVQSGKKGAKEKLYKYVESGVITIEQYHELVGNSNTSHN